MASTTFTTRALTAAVFTLLAWAANPVPSRAQQTDPSGCTYSLACNYNPEALTDDGSCLFPEPNYDCAGNCLLDLNNNGLCDLEEVAGCTNIDAINFDASATLDNGTCMVTCKGDFNNDGTINVNDLLGFLAAFGNQCEGAGCMDPAGCNYDPNATFNLDFCEYPDLYFNCDGTPVNDADGDGVPDELEVLGCTNAEACNYDALATDDNGSCELPAEFFNCDGTPLNDTDGDGIPNELEVPGCTNSAATNYNPAATDDDGSCTLGIQGDEHTCGAENVHNPDLIYGSVTDIDGNTYRTIVIGNQEWMAENLNVSRYSNLDEIPNLIGNNWGTVLANQGAWCYYDDNEAFECPYGKLYNWYTVSDPRGLCPSGWHVPSNADWDALRTELGGGQISGGPMKSTGFDFWLSPNISATNESGFSGLPGGYCSNGGADDLMSYEGRWWSTNLSNNNTPWYYLLRANQGNTPGSASSTKKSGHSVRCVRSLNTGCSEDSDGDGDGVCDSDEYLGCTNTSACNYTPAATDDDGTCVFAAEFFDCEGAPLNDSDGDGIPNELEVPGCTNSAATNYNPAATDDDGSCTLGIQGDEHTCGAENVHNPDLIYGSVTDIDGNTYRTIVIGNQEWMAENLNVSRYSNGDLIPNITDNGLWQSSTNAAWCDYNNSVAVECPYGKLYKWYVTIDNRNVCPAGWHVPSDQEWFVLMNFLGGEPIAGGKLKSMNYFYGPNFGATNETGFSGLGGGIRSNSGNFADFGWAGYYWSSTENGSSGTTNAWARMLEKDNSYLSRIWWPKPFGLSIRCVKD